MKNILYIAVGLVFGIGASAFAATNWQEIFSQKILPEDSGVLKVYTFNDGSNVCYTSVVSYSLSGISTAISCIKEDSLVKIISEPTPSSQVPVKVFRTITK